MNNKRKKILIIGIALILIVFIILGIRPIKKFIVDVNEFYEQKEIEKAIQNDNWALNLTFYDSSIDEGKTPLKEINWNASDEGYDKGETRVITIQINYKNTNLVNTYEPGDLKIEIPNFAESFVNLSNDKDYAEIDVKVSANTGNQNQGFEWNFEGDELVWNDEIYTQTKPYGDQLTYRFINNRLIEENTNLEGSIQISYVITPNEDIPEEFENECVQEIKKSIQASLNNIVNSNSCDFNYYRKCVHNWEKEQYEINLKTKELRGFDSLPEGYEEYWWVNYCIDSNRKNDPELPIELTEKKFKFVLPKECVLLSDKFEEIENTENIEEYFGTNGFGDNNFIVGYPKNIYNEENENLIIDLTVDLTGIYENGTDRESIATDDVSINLQEFGFSYSGDQYSLMKEGWMDTLYSDFMLNPNLNNYKTLEYLGSYFAVYSGGEPLTIRFGDDVMYITDSNNEYRKLEDDEYHFTQIEFPDMENINGIRIPPDKYNAKLYVRYPGETEYAESKEYTGGGSDVYPDETVVGYYWELTGVKESIFDSTQRFCHVKYHPHGDIYPSGRIYNLNYLQVFKETSDGLVLANPVDISSYSSFNSKELVSKYDLETYGHLIQREEGSKAYSEYNLKEPKYTLEVENEFGQYSQDNEKERITGRYEVEANLATNFENTDNQDEWLSIWDGERYKDKMVKRLEIYDLLPIGMKVTSTEEEIIESVFSEGTDWYFADKSDIYYKNEKEDYYKEHTKVEINENWNQTGRTRISIIMDFSDAPIIFLHRNDRGLNSWVSWNVKYYVPYDSLLEYGKDYKNLVYGQLYLVDDTTTKVKNSVLDNGEKDKDAKDINQNQNTEEELSYAESNISINAAFETRQDLQVSVGTDESDFSTGITYTPTDSEYEYKIRVRTGQNDITNLVVYNSIESYIRLTDDSVVESSEGKENWKGEFIGVDTSIAEKNGYKVKVWYSTEEYPKLLDEGDWNLYTEDIDKSTVKQIAFQYLDENGDPAVIPRNSLTYVTIKMKSLSDTNVTSYAYNGAWTQWNAISEDGSITDFITGIRSNIVKVSLRSKLNIEVSKVWVDNNNQLKMRPEEINLVLLQNDKTYRTASVTEEDNWKYIFEDLPIYNEDNEEYEYTVEEETVNLYNSNMQKSEDGKKIVITNTLIEEKLYGDIYVNKIWEDDENIRESRSEKITLNLLRDGEIIETVDVTKAENWQYTFTDVQIWKNNYEMYNYSITENKIDKYDTTIEQIEDSENAYLEFNITNTYRKIPTSVLVHHYYEGTEEKISEDVLIEGIVWDKYKTEKAEDIPANYEVVYIVGNQEGIMTEEQIEVIYYYKLIPVNVTKNTVVKEGTAEIDERTDKVSYKITYEGTIDTYIGEVAVYLEDTLPYDIDVEESDLDGGTYNEETRTITWYENVGEIDTLETGENVPATIRVEKTIEVLYKDIDIYQDSMINEIKGVMYLPADNRTVEDESEFETEIAVKGDLVVKYIDKNTNEEISSRVEKTGRVGTEYDVTGDKKEISGYTLIEEPAVKTGTYTEESQEKIYYYAKNTDVHVRYVDKISKEEIAEEEIIEGYEGQKYATDKKEIEGYTFVEDSGNTEGEMTRERTEVVYYYLYKTKVRVEHRDKYTDGLLGEEEQEGLEGEVYESSAKDFEGYVLVEEPENRTVTMTKEEIVLIYYYSYISGGVIEKHIDEITGEILDEEVYEGKEGDPYSTKEKEFRGYDLVEEKYPANSSGEMTRDVIEVKYYYIKRATVRVEYIDKVNDEKLTEDVIINGHENDKYRTEEKEFEGYDLVEIPENATGEMKITVNEDGTYNTEIVVTYYYKYVSAGVVEKHIDDVTGEVITEEKHTGYEGDKYETKEKEIAGYELVKEKYPENATGVMTREEIEVDYYYIKKATVRVEYVDKYTGNKIIEDVIISGHEKEEYKTEEKEFEGYDYIEVVGETEGTMTPDEEKVITYYYLKPATVITRYLEEETEEELAPEDIVEGHEGDEYVTGAKEIEYYKISKLPENATGEMKDTIYVTYYYKKKIVDFSLDKTIDSMKVEGKAQRITNEDLVKAEVYRKSINSTDIKVVFNIKVTNEGEIAGKVDILEKIPEYLSMSEKDNPGWTVEGEEARYETETIEAGKSKTYKVVMTWKKGDGHFGMQKNIAKIEKVITPSGFDEENLQNNSDESEVMITISTGVEKVSGIVLIALIYMLAIIYMNRKLTFAKVEVEDDKKEK